MAIKTHHSDVPPVDRSDPAHPSWIRTLVNHSAFRYLVVGAPSFLNGSTIYVDGGQTAMAPTPTL